MATTVEEEQLKVLNLWASPFGMRVLIALDEKGLQYDYQEEVDVLSNKSQLLLQMNPIYNKIPVLIHNGNPICESLIIVNYIDETWPHQPLLPAHPYAGARARFWADFVDKKVYDSGSRLLRSKGEALEEAKRDVLGCLELLEGALRDMSGGEGLILEVRNLGSWISPSFLFWAGLIPLGILRPRRRFSSRCSRRGCMKKCLERESVKKVFPAPERISELGFQLMKILVAG